MVISLNVDKKEDLVGSHAWRFARCYSVRFVTK